MSGNFPLNSIDLMDQTLYQEVEPTWNSHPFNELKKYVRVISLKYLMFLFPSQLNYRMAKQAEAQMGEIIRQFNNTHFLMCQGL